MDGPRLCGLSPGLLATLCLCAVATARAQDDLTVALWLFDEPVYPCVTLSDAGPDLLDLRLHEAGVLGPGRFGQAVGRRPGMAGRAVGLAAERTHYPNDWQGPLSARWAPEPQGLVEVLNSGEWTWEFWFRLDPKQLPREEASLLDVGRGLLRITLGPAAAWLRVQGRSVGHARQSVDLSACRPDDGEWHHLAVVGPGHESRPQVFVDRVTVPVQHLPAVPPLDVPEMLPHGLAGRIFGSPDFTRPAQGEVMSRIDCRWGRTYGSAWSGRWVGFLTLPADDRVRLRAESDGEVRLILGGQPVIEGQPQEGRELAGYVGARRGERLPLVLEYATRTGDAFLRLHWSWNGRDEEVVPAEAFAFRPDAWEGRSRFELALLGTVDGQLPLSAWIDEMRVSRRRLYTEEGAPPQTLAPVRTSVRDRTSAVERPPLLFGERSVAPVPLGRRKHLFVDDALVEDSDGVTLRQAPVSAWEYTDLQDGLGDASVLRSPDGRIRLYYGGWFGSVKLATSQDGIHFTVPNLGVTDWGLPGNDNGVFLLPGQASVFLDTNPAASPSEQFKAFAWIMTRGIYGLTSEDGVRWRRSPGLMLPFDCGGGVEGFWDDQRGTYVCHVRHEGYFARTGAMQRIAARAENTEFHGPWPFDPDPAPVARKAFTLPALWDELPLAFVPTESGEVYRCRAVKYPWAPDVYLAFVWRYDTARERRVTELATSRDNRNWRFFGMHPPWIPVDEPVLDKGPAQATLAVHGLVRDGDEVWQYAEISTAGHGGGQSAVVRLRTPLDRFVALSAGPQSGAIVTRPLVFAGERLIVNADVRGELRVGLLSADRTAIPSVTADRCFPIVGDSLLHLVQWRDTDELTELAGVPIRLELRMREADLYSIRFE